MKRKCEVWEDRDLRREKDRNDCLERELQQVKRKIRQWEQEDSKRRQKSREERKEKARKEIRERLCVEEERQRLAKK